MASWFTSLFFKAQGQKETSGWDLHYLGKDDSLNLLVLILNFMKFCNSTARFCSKKINTSLD